MPPRLGDSFSYPAVAVRQELPPHPSLETPPFAMNGFSSPGQFSSMLAAGPYFSRPADMAVIVLQHGPSKPPATTKQSRVSPPDSPKSSAPVHGYYSNQMKKQKKTAGKTTGGKTTAGKTTRTRKVAPIRETQPSPLKRGFEETGRGEGEGEGEGKGEGEEDKDGDGDGTRSLKRQKR